jgi:PEP-CTERM motif
LFLINTADASTTTIGGSVSNTFGSTEIEYDNIGGTAFSQDVDGLFQGNFFDITTGSPTGLTISNGGSHTGLEYVGSTLYATVIFGPQGPSELHTLVASTGVSTLIGRTGVGPISGLAYDGTTMYGIAGGPGPATLYTIALGSGAASPVFTTSFRAGSLQFGLDGNLYAGGTGPNAGALFRIDLSNNTDTLVGATGFGSITGLTLIAVPEPSTMLLLAVGLFPLLSCAPGRRSLG